MANKANILLVEDDPNLGSLLCEFLNNKGFTAQLCTDGEMGYETFTKGNYQFLILDVMMPKKDGFTLAKEIRKIDADVPILFLTAKSLREDTLKGFNVGADDYMTKPFSMEELLARINAILRRSIGTASDEKTTYTLGDFEFNPAKQELINKGVVNKLTTKESMLLKLLTKNKNKTLERNEALKAVWGDDNYFNGRSMDVYITKLRKHLKSEPKIEIINVHGLGFKLLLEEEA